MQVLPESFPGGAEPAVVVLRLKQSAGDAGEVLQITSDAPDIVDCPARIAVSVKRTATMFRIVAKPVAAPRRIKLTARRTDGSSQSAVFMVRPATIASIRVAPDTLAPGADAVGVLSLDAPPAVPVSILLSADSPAVQLTPTTVELNSNEQMPVFSVRARQSSTEKHVVTVTAKASDGTQRTVTVTVTSPASLDAPKPKPPTKAPIPKKVPGGT